VSLASIGSRSGGIFIPNILPQPSGDDSQEIIPVVVSIWISPSLLSVSSLIPSAVAKVRFDPSDATMILTVLGEPMMVLSAFSTFTSRFPLAVKPLIARV